MRLSAGVTYEGFGRRLLAGLFDLTLMLVVVVTLVLLGLAIDESPPRASVLVADLSGLRSYGLWLLGMILSAQALFWTFLAATPGMLLFGCQVLRAGSGRRLSLARSLVRSAGLWLGLASLGIGVLWIIWDPRHQGLHDKLAGAVVVKEDESLLALDELLEGVK
ncbi:MAG: hypothetical protein BMS9Abin14_776 [Gammaproteobacteria bacterium]|nr:MAG: hypothetical protein BMS9Abin14_776 [Gammaproteobacteria bacterium]